MAAPSPSPIRWALCAAENSLERQSTRHPDGWGLATFNGGDRATLHKGADPAFADGRYRMTLRGVDAHHVIAHVRRATVGPRAVRNNHPFRCGPWTLAHNGTLNRIEDIRQPIRDVLRDELRGNIGGETDSELLFHLIMAYLWEDEGTIDAGLGAAGRAVERAVNHVAELDEKVGAEDPSEMNVILSRGDGFVATRYGHSLYVLDDPDPAANHTADGPDLSDTVAVASERVARRSAWSEVDPRTLLVLRPGDEAEVRDLDARVVA